MRQSLAEIPPSTGTKRASNGSRRTVLCGGFSEVNAERYRQWQAYELVKRFVGSNVGVHQFGCASVAFETSSKNDHV